MANDDEKMVFRDVKEGEFWERVYLTAMASGFNDPEGEADVAAEILRVRRFGPQR